ncbi:6-hydroxy-D-nicotine oxidase [Fusarium heterosporum]|uniref:6-hydroxy-D-nicotine oxidase n=1 Tax=Fusarium heterosporum TaxID=42747 RepID=A0A8H5T3Q5_FUSHE|nr:6-hydroxy-D-nicotine oxidase [Fusarium heterosporum]
MTQTKFSSLRNELVQGRLLLPGDDGYEESLQRWSLTCVKPAAAVAQPKTAEEASAVVKFAASNGIKFNVKGGGHSTSQTSCAPSPDGMVLDLSLMREVSVDTEAQTITFGGGCLWKDVDDALWPKGLATVGGTVSHTGVGGLILHGGYGILSGIHGLAIDVLLSCQVVLADGSIVTASSLENADLFWALRGAGSSFGVVTQFTSKVFAQGDIWGGVALLPPDTLPTVVEFINKWGETNDGTQLFLVGFTYGPPGPDPDVPRSPVVLVQMAQIGPNPTEDGTKYFAPLLELEALVKQVGPMPYPNINRGSDEAMATGSRYLFGGANFTLPMELSTAESIHDRFVGFVESEPDTAGSAVLIECIPTQKIKEFPVESTAFNSRGSYFNIGIQYKWQDENLDTNVRAFNRVFQKEIRTLGYNDESMSDGIGHYLNYVSTDQISAKEAFGSNSKRLKTLKKQYDPNNVFDKLWKLVGEVEDNWIA